MDTRYSGCRRNLDYLLIYRTLRLIGLSQSALAGGKTATSNLIKNSATGKRADGKRSDIDSWEAQVQLF